MVRPSRESLNRLAQIIRDSKPLYAECTSILNKLAALSVKRVSLAPAHDSTVRDLTQGKFHADSKHHTPLETACDNPT